MNAARTVAPLPDPRRPGKPLALVTCWCGRDYTLTGPALIAALTGGVRPCPSCGRVAA